MSQRLTLAVAFVAGLASVALLWTDAVPLGVPGEWTWGRLQHTAGVFPWTLLLVGVCGGVYVAVAAIGERGIDHASRGGVALRLALLAAAGFLWLGGVQSAAIEEVGLGKGPVVLFSRASSGYFQQARYDVASTREFLAEYKRSIAVRGDDVPSDIYLHIGTHPPGLTLVFRGLLALCDQSPGLVSIVNATQPDGVRQSSRQLTQTARRDGLPFSPSDAAVLWLATLLVQIAAALTVVPLYLWLRVSEDRATSWRTAALWPLVPAVVIFLPKSDALFPLIAITAAWLWRSGWNRGRFVPCLLAGTTLFAGMLLSLAFVPVAALIGVQTLADGWPRDTAPRLLRSSRGAQPWLLAVAAVIAGGLGFVLPMLAMRRWADVNLASVWWWNLRNHALFYDHFPRTWWKWLLVNPLELTLAVGAPVILLAKLTGWQAWRMKDWSALRTTSIPAVFLVWTALWLSGKNMGEAARLWIFLTPWVVACAAPALRSGESAPTGEPGTSVPGCSPSASDPFCRGTWLTVLVLQLIVCAATALRVDGFDFTQMLKR